jgi:hypothetical protein
VSYLDTMREFIGHVDKLCVLGLQAERGHALLQQAVLGFWETVQPPLRHTRRWPWRTRTQTPAWARLERCGPGGVGSHDVGEGAQVVLLPTANDLPFVLPPSQYIVYHLAFAPHALSLSRLGDLLEGCVGARRGRADADSDVSVDPA